MGRPSEKRELDEKGATKWISHFAALFCTSPVLDSVVWAHHE